MHSFAKARLVDLKAAIVGAGIEISLKLRGAHRDTNKTFMTVSAKKTGLLGGKEVVGVCHDLEWWFVDLEDWPKGPELLDKWGIPYEVSDRGF
ncbi:hypothetical protein D3C77_332090 [compost metagenome]